MKTLRILAILCFVAGSAQAIPPGHLEGFVKRLEAVKYLGTASLAGTEEWKSGHAAADYDNYLILLGTLEGIVQTMTDLQTPASAYGTLPERKKATIAATLTLDYIKTHPAEATAATSFARIVADALTEAYPKK